MPAYRCCDLIDRGHAVHALEHALLSVIVRERRRLRPISRKSFFEHARIVVCADRLATGCHLSYTLLDAPEQNALVHFELYHGIKLQTPFGQQAIERFRLRDRARKAIEHKAALGVGLANAVSNDRHDNLVWNQLAAFHDAFGAQPYRCSGSDSGTEHVPGRELDNSVFGYQALRLRALPRPRRAEQDQSHRVRPRSLERLIRPSYW